MEEFENYKQGQYLPRLSIDKVHQRAEKILYSKAFQNALSGEKYRELALGGDSVALVNAVNQARAELGPHSDDSKRFPVKGMSRVYSDPEHICCVCRIGPEFKIELIDSAGYCKHQGKGKFCSC